MAQNNENKKQQKKKKMEGKHKKPSTVWNKILLVFLLNVVVAL